VSFAQTHLTFVDSEAQVQVLEDPASALEKPILEPALLHSVPWED